jgi:hypothetical protein
MGALILASACSDATQVTSTTGSGNGGSAGTSGGGSGGHGAGSGGNGGSAHDASASADGSDSGGTSVDSSVDTGANVDTGATADADASVDTDASADTGANDAGSDARTDAAPSKCSTPCTGATPLCDEASATCKAIEVLAFYTVYEQMADLAHRSFSREANAWFPSVAQANGFTFESTTNWSRLSGVVPAKGRVVLFFDNAPSVDQVASFKSYMDKGGAWMGFHVSAYNDTSTNASYNWYFRELLGCGRFFNNTWRPTSANLKVEDPMHPVTDGLGTLVKSAPSEWYSWEIDLRTKPNIKVLCSVDPSSFPLGTDPNQSWRSGYYPIVWTNTNYKMVYANFGHNDMDYGPQPDGKTLSFTFGTAKQNQMVLQAIRWLGGVSRNP